MKHNLVSHCRKGTSDKFYIYSIRPNADGTYTVLGKWGRRGGRKLDSQVKAVCTTEADAVAEINRLHRERIRNRGYVDIESKEYDGPMKMTDKAVMDNLEGSPASHGPGTTLDILSGQRYLITAPQKRKRYVSGPASIKLKEDETVTKATCTCKCDTFESAVDINVKRVAKCTACGKLWSMDGKAVKVEEYENDVVVCIDNTGMEDKFDEGIEYIYEDHDTPGMLYVYDKLGQK